MPPGVLGRQTHLGAAPLSVVDADEKCLALARVGSAVDLAMDVTRRRGRVVAGSTSPLGHNVSVYGRGWLAGVELVGAYFNSRPWRLDTTETTSPLNWPVRPIDGDHYRERETDTGAGDIELFNPLPESKSLGHLIYRS